MHIAGIRQTHPLVREDVPMMNTNVMVKFYTFKLRSRVPQGAGCQDGLTDLQTISCEVMCTWLVFGNFVVLQPECVNWCWSHLLKFCVDFFVNSILMKTLQEGVIYVGIWRMCWPGPAISKTCRNRTWLYKCSLRTSNTTFALCGHA
jgi:hypothetical protein